MTNLFIYGTLRKETVVKAITGRTFPRNRAVLHGYKIFAQKSGFPYILPVQGGRVNGFILRDVDEDSLRKIDRYEDEGTIYSRVMVEVESRRRKLKAYTYVGNIGNIRRTFGDHIDETINTRVEKYLEEQLGEHIPLTRYHQTYDDVEFQSRKEFFECEIQHLLNLYFTNTYISPNRIDENFDVKRIPSLREVKADERVRPHVPAYLDLVCRFMVFNRLADIIHFHHRPALFTRETYCMYSLTNLVTLRFLNIHKDELDHHLSAHCPPEDFECREYTDYAEGAARIAVRFHHEYKTEIEFMVREIGLNKQEGRVPMGAEMEFSRVGRHAVFNCRPRDAVYDNFKHFLSFDLLRRCWRLGGHIDDHVLSPQPRKTEGGFLEFALGKNPLLQYTSKPVSNDIYVLSSLISEVTSFVPVPPHSLHITLENVLGEIDWEKENDVDLIKCLLLLGGDFRLSIDGHIVEKRIGCREIIDPWGNTEIITENRQYPLTPELEEEEKPTVEFQFPRLVRGKSYTPLIMGIKGFYLGYNPRPYSSKIRIIDAPHIRAEAEELKRWGLRVTPLPPRSIENFLSHVEKGLFTGLHEMPLKHRKRFLQRGMFLVEKEVKSLNEWIRNASRSALTPSGRT